MKIFVKTHPKARKIQVLARDAAHYEVWVRARRSLRSMISLPKPLLIGSGCVLELAGEAHFAV